MMSDALSPAGDDRIKLADEISHQLRGRTFTEGAVFPIHVTGPELDLILTALRSPAQGGVEDLEALRALSEAASDGEWHVEHGATTDGLSRIDDGRQYGMHPIYGEAHEIALACAAIIPDGMRVQYWLARLDRYGNPKLVDGAHSAANGAHHALHLFQSLGLGKGESYAVARVELIEAVPDPAGTDEEAIATLNSIGLRP